MNNTEQERYCQKCGKRLPSSNNFCMYCGYNNNLNDEELEALKSINSNNIHTKGKQELLNKSINAKDREVVIEKVKRYKVVSAEEQAEIIRYKNEHSTLKNKIIYVFILLDIIFISGILLFKSDGLLYEKFNVKLEEFDNVINIDNKSFLGLRENKIEVLGDNINISTSNFNEINNEGVLGISKASPNSNDILIETTKKIYSVTNNSSIISNNSTFKFKEKKIDKTSKNFYKDVNTNYYNRISITGDYFNILKENSYFIRDDCLYKNVIASKEKEEDWYIRSKVKKTDTKPLKVVFRFEKVYDTLDIDNPEVVDISDSGKSVIVKGDNAIKMFTEGELIQSITSITYNKKRFDLKDFKYILYNKGNFVFVNHNGSTITYPHSINNYRLIDDAELFGPRSSRFKSIHKNEIDKNVIVSNDDIVYSPVLSINNINWKIVGIIIAAIAILIGVIYHFRNTSYIISSFIYSGVILLYVAALLFYLASQLKKPDYFEIFKSLLQTIPIDFIIGLILSQLKEIVNYISDKFNIETVYHFVLLFIGLTTTLLAVSLFTNNIFLLLVLPGIIWIFTTENMETFKIYNMDFKMLIKLVITLFISVVLSFLVCFTLNICQHFLYVLIVSFSISCFLVLNDEITLVNCYKKFFNANIVLLLTWGFIMIYGIFEMFNIDPKYGEEILSELSDYYLKSVVLSSFVRIILICIVCIICASVIFFISKISRVVLDGFTDNRILKIFIYMVGISVLSMIIILTIPLMDIMYTSIIKLLFGNKTAIFDLMGLIGI